MSRTSSLCVAALALGALLLPVPGTAAPSVSAGALVSGDGFGFSWREYRAELARGDGSSGQRLLARWHEYALAQDLAGIHSFSGTEPAVRLGAHHLLGLWWVSGAVGFQGTADLEGAVGEFVLARAIPIGLGAITPRIEIAREPVATTPLPLSLGLLSARVEALVAFRAPGWIGETGARFDRWEPGTIAGRVQNPALQTTKANRIGTVHGYVLTQGGGWIDAGLAAKVTSATENTFLATRLVPSWQYTWYPAAAPVFAYETALVLRIGGQLLPSLAAGLQLLLPALSRETRQWESLRQASWGTGPFEAKAQIGWSIFDGTTVEILASFFGKPWENWDLFHDNAYRQATVQVWLRQNL